MTPQKNLPNSAMKIIESENVNHCIVRAFNEDGQVVAESFPENAEQQERMIASLSEQYFRVEEAAIEHQESAM